MGSYMFNLYIILTGENEEQTNLGTSKLTMKIKSLFRKQNKCVEISDVALTM